MSRVCAVDGCERPSRGHSYCGMHSHRFVRHGDPVFTRQAPRGLSLEERLRFIGWEVDSRGCWNWRGALNKKGYGALNFRGSHILPHRAAYQVWIGPIPDQFVVMHSCDNPRCINPEHLSVGTTADNNQDRDQQGRFNALKGSKNGNAKLSENDVREIRARYCRGVTTYQSLADEFCVDQSLIARIIKTTAWTHVKETDF